MQKISVTLTMDEEKLKALEIYLKQENSSIQKKMEAAVDQLYEQTVPEPVREYLDAMSGTKPKRIPKAKPKTGVMKEAAADGES